MSSNTEETDTITQIKESSFFIQWITVIIIMIGINIILSLTFKNISPSFFCSNLQGNKYITPNNILGIFSIICFIIIFTVRELSRNQDIPGATSEEQTETIKDAIPYIILTVAAYTYASSFIRRKFQVAGTSPLVGGASFASATVQKIEKINYGTLTLFIGILVFIVNIMSYIFLYLRNKGENRKNKYARSIYFAQIATLIIGILTSFFVAGFGCQTFKTNSSLNIIKAAIKWILVISLSIFGINIINKATDGEDWFGGTKEENENDE